MGATLSRLAWAGAAAVVAAGIWAEWSAHHALRLAALEPRLGPAGGLGVLAVVAGIAAAALDRHARGPAPARAGGRVLSPLAIVDAEVALAVREQLAQLGQQLATLAAGEDPKIIELTDALLQAAIRVGASDVHIHPVESGTRIAFRVHGVLQEVFIFPARHHARLTTRLKVMARLVTYRADRPQDGVFAVHADAGTADIRVSLLPTNHGEKAVLRIARARVELPELAALGFPAPERERFHEVLSRPQGLVFVTGPTGSGKTTTLYASLGHIKRARGELTQIATIEDPVEFDLPFLTQTQVNMETGLTFAQGLRSILRQDPNVIMVGEIRDAETARIAAQAGLTGHLILTTVHASSAAGVFNRLIEMGVEPFVLASASAASVSQRLVRTLCRHCREAAAPTADEAARLAALGQAGGTFFTARGCPRCGGAGYLGRTALYEVLTVTPQLRDIMNGKVPTPRIHEAAIADGMTPLVVAGVERARAGETSLREVFRTADV